MSRLTALGFNEHADVARTYDGTAPSHFFGELTKTPEGCQFLQDNGIVAGLAAVVRSHGLESRDDALMTNLKCALWALVRISTSATSIADADV